MKKSTIKSTKPTAKPVVTTPAATKRRVAAKPAGGAGAKPPSVPSAAPASTNAPTSATKRRAVAAVPPVSWEATKLNFQSALEAAAGGELYHKPKSTAGLVRVNTLGVYIKADRLPAFCEAQRLVSAQRREFLDRYPAAMFEAEIRAANNSEAIALTTLGLTYHDDRGDGNLYVPAFRSAKYLSAWITAAAAAGIITKVRAA